MSDTWILYQTANLVNGKIYVGVHHVKNTSKSRTYLGSGDGLRAAIEKYGRKSFTRATLAEFSCVENVYDAEEAMVTQEFINREDTYNMKIGGMGHRGYVPTEEHRAKVSAANKGRKHTPKAKARMSAAQKGRVFSEEHKANMGVGHIGHTYNLGRHHSEETKTKISLAQKGKIPKSKPVMIDNKYYVSLNQAAKLEKIPLTTMLSRIRNSNFKWVEWRYAKEEETSNFSAMVDLEG